MDKRWAQAPCRRDQLVLYAQRVDELVGASHPIRVLEQCLDLVDWGPWEARHVGWRGQPPIHPRLMAGSLLYGLLRGLRSSRQLEDATRERVDFRWFLEGRTIDHATFARFRTAFGEELKGLFREIARQVCARYEDALRTLVIDGTRIRANSARTGAKTAEQLDRLVTACTQELERHLAQLAEQDAQGSGDGGEVERLRTEVEQLRAQVAQYEAAREVARARDAAKQAVEGAQATAVRVPVTDPDAQITPNKEGGYAPNYTPTVAVDPGSRVIVSGEVLAGSEEPTAVLPAVAAAETLGGATPDRVLADSGFATGENLEALEAQGIEAYMPTKTDFSDRNPAHRPDPTQPVAQDRWADLPRCGTQLAGAAFIYDERQDCYYCPMGRPLVRQRAGAYGRTGIRYVQYVCPGQAGCPLAAQCVKPPAAARTVSRDQYQAVRETVGRRMATPEGQTVYRQRAPVVEGVIGEVKHVLGIRRFLLRGLEKVRTEWTWICTAFNLKRLMALLTAARTALEAKANTPTKRQPPAARGKRAVPLENKPASAHSDTAGPLGVLRMLWSSAILRPRTATGSIT
jgi:transposase